MMEHLARTRGNYLAPAAAAPAERKQQIMDHVSALKDKPQPPLLPCSKGQQRLNLAENRSILERG